MSDISEARIVAACQGKSHSQGGLNLPDIKALLRARGLPSDGLRADLLKLLCTKGATQPREPQRREPQRREPQRREPQRREPQRREPQRREQIVEPAEERKVMADDPYFYADTDLLEKNRKYCRCTAHVAEKQPEWCLREKAWGKTRGKENCYNPYAICTRTVGRVGNPECFKYMNVKGMRTAEEARKYLIFHGKL